MLPFFALCFHPLSFFTLSPDRASLLESPCHRGPIVDFGWPPHSADSRYATAASERLKDVRWLVEKLLLAALKCRQRPLTGSDQTIADHAAADKE